MFGTVSEPLPTKVGLLKGVDFKGVGGYIVGPGSVHISGNLYRWDRSAMPRRGACSAEAPPPWLVKMVLATKLKPKHERTPTRMPHSTSRSFLPPPRETAGHA